MKTSGSLQLLSPKVCTPASVNLDPLIQEQWIRPNLCLNVVSHSHLLREALIHLLQNAWGNMLDSYVGNDASDNDSDVGTLSQHLIVLDYGMGRDATFRYLQQWRSQHPSFYIMVVELQDEGDVILDCIEAGAHGYVLQGATSREIIQTVAQIYRGLAHCPPDITAKLFERLAQTKTMLQTMAQPSREKPPLTQRELEVLHYVVKGCSNRDIATALLIEVRTVKHHVHNLLHKLEVKHREQVAQLAIEHGWLSQS
jgi:DNA-binding NarL/FixJ family response regulator